MQNKTLFCILVAFLFSACSKYYRFDELYDRGNYVKAFALLGEIRSKNEIHYQRRYLRVVIRMALDGDADFINLLRTVVTNEYTNALRHYTEFGSNYILFMDARSPDDYLTVISNFQNIKETPEEFLSYAYKMRGIAYFRTTGYEDAIEDFNRSYRIIPYVDNFYYLGACYLELRDYKQSFNYFNRLLNSTRDNFYKGLALFGIGEIYYSEAKYRDALESYLESANYYSENADCTYKIARCLEKLKYNRITPKFYKISLRIQKDYASAWYFLNIN